MKNSGVRVGQSDPYQVECEKGFAHFFREFSRPEGQNSGVHVDKCVHCGLTWTYDTSD